MRSGQLAQSYTSGEDGGRRTCLEAGREGAMRLVTRGAHRLTSNNYRISASSNRTLHQTSHQHDPNQGTLKLGPDLGLTDLPRSTRRTRYRERPIHASHQPSVTPPTPNDISDTPVGIRFLDGSRHRALPPPFAPAHAGRGRRWRGQAPRVVAHAGEGRSGSRGGLGLDERGQGEHRAGPAKGDG